MTLGTWLLIILTVLLIGTISGWSYGREWGYGPGGLLGIALIVVLISLLTGH